MRMMTAPGMTFTNGSGQMADNAKKEYDGSDHTVGRGVGKRPPRSAQILDRPKPRLNYFRETFEPLEIERTLRKESRERGPAAAQHQLNAREDNHQGRD